MGAVVLAFTLGISWATAIITGLAPALGSSRPDLQGMLKDGGRGVTRSWRTPLRSALVIADDLVFTLTSEQS